MIRILLVPADQQLLVLEINTTLPNNQSVRLLQIHTTLKINLTKILKKDLALVREETK
jgi:hypothetical protein